MGEKVMGVFGPKDKRKKINIWKLISSKTIRAKQLVSFHLHITNMWS